MRSCLNKSQKCVCVFVYTCMHVCARECVHVRACMHVCVCGICTFVCTHVYVCRGMGTGEIAQ